MLGICQRKDKRKYNAFIHLNPVAVKPIQKVILPSRLVVPLRCAKSKLLRNCWLRRRQREVNITRLSQNKLHPQNIRMEMMLSPSISHGVYWIQCSSKEKINSNSPGKDAVMYTAFSKKKINDSKVNSVQKTLGIFDSLLRKDGCRTSSGYFRSFVSIATAGCHEYHE